MQETDTAIELDPGSIANRGDTYSSLTDLYEIKVFSDSFQETRQELLQAKRQIEADNYRMVFSDAVQSESTNPLLEILFTNIEYKGKREAYQEQSSEWLHRASIVAGTMACLLFLVIMIQRAKNRLRKAGTDDPINLHTTYPSGI